ncbi:MAG TPA: ArsR/SmtB family transcription factor [Cyclobacteriaceae bacterium]
MENVIDVEKLQKVASVLKTVAHPSRIAIVNMLTHTDKMSVNEICNALEAEQSLISHHLNIMRLNGILDKAREGKNIFYSLKLKELEKVMDCMENCEYL